MSSWDFDRVSDDADLVGLMRKWERERTGREVVGSTSRCTWSVRRRGAHWESITAPPARYEETRRPASRRFIPIGCPEQRRRTRGATQRERDASVPDSHPGVPDDASRRVASRRAKVRAEQERKRKNTAETCQIEPINHSYLICQATRRSYSVSNFIPIFCQIVCYNFYSRL